VRRLTARLDGVDVEQARVPAAAIKRSLKETSPGVLRALETLTENLRATARETMPQPSRQVLAQGQIVSTRPMPVDRAGVYAPGGRAAYPSSAVMALVPAQVAGVKEIAVCSAPGADGLPSHAVLAACSLAGVEEVYAIGGAQAVAAMALGTETIPPVDVLVGPGNAFVEEAKRGLFGEVGIESLAGPSELIVLADETAPPDVVASDLRDHAARAAAWPGTGAPRPGTARGRSRCWWPWTRPCSRPCRPSGPIPPASRCCGPTRGTPPSSWSTPTRPSTCS